MHQVLYIVQLPNEEGDMHITTTVHVHSTFNKPGFKVYRYLQDLSTKTVTGKEYSMNMNSLKHFMLKMLILFNLAANSHYFKHSFLITVALPHLLM